MSGRNSWHRELVHPGPVVEHRQPAGEPRVDRVVVVAGRGLRDLGVERLRVAQQQVPQGGAAPERRPQLGRPDPQGGALHPDHGLDGRAPDAEDDGEAARPSWPTTPTSWTWPSSKGASVETGPPSTRWAARTARRRWRTCLKSRLTGRRAGARAARAPGGRAARSRLRTAV